MDISGDWAEWVPGLDDEALLDGNVNLDEVPHLFEEWDGAANAGAAAHAAPAQSLPPPQQQPRTQYDDYNDALCAHCRDAQRLLSDELARLGWAQKNLALPPQPAAVQQQQQRTAELRARLAATQRDAAKPLHTAPLQPRTLYALHALEELLVVLQCQLEVLEAELQALCAGKPYCAARLCVVAQEAGKPVKQNSASQVVVRVRILTGALADIRPTSAVQGVLEAGAANATLPLDNAQAAVSATGEALFEDLRFPVASRAAPVRLRFKVNVQWSSPIANGTVSLVSNASQPVIVCSGEAQYAPALGKLIALDLFEREAAVDWFYFVNRLQWYYLEVTRQDKSAPLRPLSLHDISYLHQFKLGNSPTITADTFHSFWDNWFGIAITGIRHSRLISELWTRGYLMGFISKVGAENLLRSEKCPPGTFLLRFSERSPGSFAIAYVKRSKSKGDMVKHYLLRPGDVAPPQRTLADFLGSQSYFVYLLQTIPAPGPTHALRWRIVPKDAAFGPYYGVLGATLDGYDESLPKMK